MTMTMTMTMINKYYIIVFFLVGAILVVTILVRNYLIEQDEKRQTFEYDILKQINATQGKTYQLIAHNTQTNLNLTKFNRASLVDTNNILHEIAEKLNITVPVFDPSKLG